MLRLPCPHCGHRLRVNGPVRPGRSVTCPACGQDFRPPPAARFPAWAVGLAVAALLVPTAVIAGVLLLGGPRRDPGPAPAGQQAGAKENGSRSPVKDRSARPKEERPGEGKRYALLVGVTTYDHLPHLKYAQNDVTELASLLRPAGYDVTLLCDSAGAGDQGRSPTARNIRAQLDRLAAKCGRSDTLLLAFAGHGVQFDDKGDSYFCPRDARLKDSGTLVSLTGVYRKLGESQAGARLLLVDACRETATRSTARGVDGTTAPRPPSGVAALFSCSRGQFAYETPKLGKGHGVFFHFVLEALRGEATNRDGEVTWDGLNEYVKKQVSRQVGPIVGGGARQTPHAMADLQGEPPVLVKVRPEAESAYACRKPERRKKLLEAHGGNERTEKAVADGLRWLALHQASDGHWSLHEFHKHARTAPLPLGRVVGDGCTPMTKMENDTAGTALALLPFLASGTTHKGGEGADGYQAVVDAGLRWLLSAQSSKAGERGSFGGGAYSHAIATMAVCEAYGMTNDAALKDPAQLALDYVADAQEPEGGSWGYSPRQVGCTSVTGWQVAALKAGQRAGLRVPRAVLEKAAKYLDAAETGRGGYCYRPTDKREPSATMTAAGGLARLNLSVNPRDRGLLATVDRIGQKPPGTADEKVGVYYEYHATQAMFHAGRQAWRQWNLGPKGDGEGGVRDLLLQRQEQQGDSKGSFPGNHSTGGRLGATSMSLLTLQVYYRYPPLHGRGAE